MPSTESHITAVAGANIALVKYWGKRSTEKNLPATGSVSLTLDSLQTHTSIRKTNSDEDVFLLNGAEASDAQRKKASRFLNLIAKTSERDKVIIESRNNFPTGAGLASSASGFAALALAGSEFFGSSLSKKELSILARQGSGSAARSIFGGFVEMSLGKTDHGDEDFAILLQNEGFWDVRMLIAITSEKEKDLGSTEGMQRTAETAPYFPSWIESSVSDIQNIKNAIAAKDIEKVGSIMEHSTFKMHGLAMAANPPILYWNPITVEAIQRIWQLRKTGIPAYITIDAGPQVKILTLPEYQDKITDALGNIDGVKQLISAKPGKGAHLIKEEVYG